MSATDDKPIKLLEINTKLNTNSRYNFNLNTLEESLEEHKMKKLAVLAIIGARSTGKSFLLNYMLRYLNNYDKEDWMGQQDEELQGLDWRESTESERLALLASKPIVMKRSNGEEIVVILIDTPGLSDAESDKRDEQTIAGLSLLASSSLVYNVVGDLSDENLQTLDQYLSSFMAKTKTKETKNKLKSFQHLMLLIRDWKSSKNYKCGLAGGKDYLSEYVLKSKEGQSDEIKSAKKSINDSFEKVECCLMPPVGDEIGTDDSSGSLKSLGADVKKCVDEFVTHLLDAHNIANKKINGKTITCNEWIQHLKAYINEVKGNQSSDSKKPGLRKARPVFDIEKLVGAKNRYLKKMISTLEKCGKTKKVITKDNLYEIHEKAERQAAIELRNLLLNNKEKYEAHVTQLKIMIKLEYANIEQDYERMLESFEQQIKNNVKELSAEYETAIKEYTEKIYDISELNQYHHKMKADIMSRFKSKNSSIEAFIFKKYNELLNDMIEKSLKALIESFNSEVNQFSRLNKYLLKDIRKSYTDEMDKYLRTADYLSYETLDKCNENVMKLLFQRYKNEKELANMSDEKYRQFINDFVKDLYEIIKDRNAMNIPNSPAIGIDLGTTNSCVAYYMNKRVIIIPNEFGDTTTPSVVSYRDTEVIVGKVAKEEIDMHPRNTIYSVKRLIGRDFNYENMKKNIDLLSYEVSNDSNNCTKIKFKVKGIAKKIYPESVSTKVLKKLKKMAEKHLNCKVDKAVITVPAYFSDTQKEATKNAGEKAGFEVLKIINEPTAAAIAYQLNHLDIIEPRNVLIYDFGGGTFDVAVLVIEKGEITVKAVGGDNHLGGDNIDENLIDYCLKQFELSTGLTPEGLLKEQAVWRLRKRCEDHKCRLTSVESTAIRIEDFYANRDLEVLITRQEFEDINNDLFERTMDLVDKTLIDANIKHNDIQDIVLVGGTTRIPKVQRMLSMKFSGQALNRFLDPDEAVARGAAYQAAILNGQQNNIMLSDVMPISLGIEVEGGKMDAIVPRNSKVPNVYKKIFPFDANYSNLAINVYEGENELVSQNILLGKLEINEIPTAEYGLHHVEIKFDSNDVGLLKVLANILGTGVKNEIEMKKI